MLNYLNLIEQNNFFIKNLTLNLPEIIFIISVLYCFAILIYIKNKNDTKNYLYLFIDLSIILLIFLNIFYLICLYYNFNFSGLTFDGLLSINSFIITGKFLIAFLTLVYLHTMAPFFVEDGIFDYEFILLILFAVTGMLLLLASNDFLTMFLSLELQSFCLYTLAAARLNRTQSVEAGLKYFILGSLASGLLLLGCSLIYLYNGLTNFTDIKMVISVSDSLLVLTGFSLGFLFILVGFLFKLGSCPFP
jgi:NADH:ubiquinone oxidoreductase subunit 2 (subunit N)